MLNKSTSIMASAPSKEAVEQVVLEALAAAQSKAVGELRVELAAAGPGMPLDSLESVEIMLELEERFGIRFPDEPETCAAFQSVQTLVRLVRELAAVEGDEGGER